MYLTYVSIWPLMSLLLRLNSAAAEFAPVIKEIR